MLRQEFVNRYNKEVADAFQELFNLCTAKMNHPGDLLLCQQNGTIWNGHPMIGLGEVGVNCFQQINAISFKGIGSLVDNEVYADSQKGFFNGSTEFELTIQTEMNTFQEIWENNFFLRTLAQIIRVANGETYDWELEMSKNNKHKSDFIQNNILKKINVCPIFYEVVKKGYHRQIRNAAAHSQYHCVSGGIWLDNYKSTNPDEIQAIGFEEWEEKYCYSYFIFIGVFEHLKSIVHHFYLPLAKETISGGIPIFCPDNNNAIIYPNSTGDIWRFCKVKEG